ncbi:MAG: hypothetical protein HZC01_02585 [Candidatus Kerfeldbacteria bacterium]|nr:hypothetical protein [Candidatus Kerfeldbacteria bacterium]
MNTEELPSSDHQSFRATNDDTSSVENELAVLQPEKITFDEKNFSLLINLSAETIQTDELTESAASHHMTKKPEFHITAFGFKTGSEIKKAVKASGNPKLFTQIKQLIETADFSYRLEPTRSHIAKDYPLDPQHPDREPEHRESYIQMVSVPGLTKLYNDINALLGTHLEPPPTHITLFTGSTYPENASQGIGIPTQAEFEKLDRRHIAETQK